MHTLEPEDAVEISDEAALWRSLHEGGTAVRELLIERHLPFARIMAGKLFARRMHDEIEFDDYLQFASIGLIECVDRYDPDRGASFRTFASHRITGAVLDGIVKLTEKQEQIACRQRARAERSDSLKEAQALGDADPQQLFESLARIAVGLAVGYLLEDSGMYRGEERSVPDRSYHAVELRQLQERVRALVDALPEREARIVRLHYLNRVPFETIAGAMGISKGRVSQLHRRAIEMLREELRKVGKCDIAW